MNIEFFREHLELMNHTGFRLTEMEAALIENSLIILQSENKFKDIFFFARIDTSSDLRYYVSYGNAKDVLKNRKYFYSLNGYEWVMMPDVNSKLCAMALKIRKPFTGDPMFMEEACMDPTFITDPEKLFIPCERSVKKIKEEDRLSCIVHLIMCETAIIPRAALYRQVNRCVTYNPCFNGLNHVEASEIKNFQLFRYPQNNRSYNLTKREDYNYQTDFFDTIDDLIPAKCFSLSINDRDVCLIRSLKWPGMHFYHKLLSKYHGFFYFGNGLTNLDLLFMI